MASKISKRMGVCKWYRALALPLLGPRTARLLLGFLFVLKLAITAYNAAAYDQKTYDRQMHAKRAQSGGLALEGRAYNPPLYYASTLPYLKFQELRGKPAPSSAELLAYLRWSNLAYLAVFYWCCIYVVFPRLAADYRSSTVASLVLLALPGYQKLAVLSHPDNALSCLSALCMALWLWLRWRHPPPESSDGRGRRARTIAIIVFALVVGLSGLTRPFGVVPAGVFLCAGCIELLRGRRLLSWRFWAATTGLVVAVVAIAGAWHGYQRFVVKRMAPVYEESYIATYEPLREGFDFVHYYTSFHFAELLEKPNRKMRLKQSDQPGKLQTKSEAPGAPSFRKKLAEQKASKDASKQGPWPISPKGARSTAAARPANEAQPSKSKWSAKSGAASKSEATAKSAAASESKASAKRSPPGARVSSRKLSRKARRKMERDQKAALANPGANSFFTLLYSETWGDHWLYFSGAYNRDVKVWPKRVLFVVALPLMPLLVLRFAGGVWQSIRRWRPREGKGWEPLVALALLVMGSALYLYWQTGDGLLPGKNSTVKFIYIAFLVPFALALTAVPPMGKLRFNLWVFYLLAVFVTAFPISLYWSIRL